MKRRTIVLLSLGAVVLALGAAPFLIPIETFKGPLESAASGALGRQVQVSGPLRLTLYPQVGIALSGVSIANATGAKESQMVAVGDVLVGAKLMPLFSRRLEVTEIVLKKPVIHLEIAKDGSANWQFAKDANGAASAGQGSGTGTLDVENVRIEDGEVGYYDARSGKNETLSAVSMTLTMPQSTGARPLNFDGTLTYHAEPLKMAAKLDDLGAVLQGEASNAHLSLTSNMFNADFTGRVATGGEVSGRLKLGSRSLRKLVAWGGGTMPPGNGFGLIALETDVSAKDGVYALSKASIAFDSMKLNGDIAFNTKPDPILITGNFTIDNLDVKPYLAQGASEDTAKAAKTVKTDTPLAFGGLKAVNADVTLTVGGMTVPDFKLDHAVIVVALHNGVLNANLQSLSAYGGTGKGNLTVDASGAVPAFHNTLEMRDFKVQPFLIELIGVKDISATGAMRFDVTARGTTQDEIVKSLNGKGDMKFTDGTLTGVDLGAVARVLQSVLTAQVLTGAVGENAKTNFGEMSSSYVIQNGVSRTNDIKLTNPTLEMTGSGDVDFVHRQMEFHLEPKAKKGIPGLQLVDIGVPFYVKGPWEKPSFGPDTRNLAKGIVNKLGEDASLPANLLKNPGRTLKSLFGGTSAK